MDITVLKTIVYTSNIVCILFILLLSITYFRKKKIVNAETSIYSVLLNVNIISLVVELIFYLVLQSSLPLIVITIVEKIYYSSTVIWMYLFTIYNFAIVKEYSKHRIYEIDISKKKKYILTTILGIIAFLSFLPLTRNYTPTGEIISSTGAAPSAMFLLCVGLLISDLIIILRYRKQLETKKTLPLYLFLGTIFAEMLLTATGTQLLLLTLPMTLVSYLMFHTIENPDVKMLEEVSMAKETAEKANSAKTEFLSNMSHEIRTPLNAIVGFSESLKDDNVPEETKGKINDIITASNNLLEIVNGILDISKIEANKLELVNKEYDIKSTLDELESLTRARIGEKGLELNVKIDPTLPRVLYGDNVRLKQVILNILTNAVKYTKEGHIDFTVSSVVKDDMCRLIVSVEDTGIGIKQENINKLFSKFERLDVEKQMTIEGTGLGLAITKKLVDLMGGTIVAQSVYGQGSKFTVSIDQKIISVKPIEKPKPLLESKIIDVSGAKALIVDDNELNIKVASTLLKKYNFTIDSCTNGQDCIKKLLEDDSYDIIFLDDMMPRMSGREVIKKLRQAEDFNIPTIALTANAIEGMKEEYLACGFDDYLSKPIEKTELERVIKTYLNKMVNDGVNSTPTEGIQSALSLSIEVPEETKKKKLRYTNCTGMNFLLVDDSEIELKVTGNLLEKNNSKITKARSGSECIVKVIDKPFDLILMDDQMPNLSGIETIENIEQIDGFKTPIILLTNAKDKDLQDKLSKSKNIIGYLRKPVDKYELNELLKKVAKKGDK